MLAEETSAQISAVITGRSMLQQGQTTRWDVDQVGVVASKFLSATSWVEEVWLRTKTHAEVCLNLPCKSSLHKTTVFSLVEETFRLDQIALKRRGLAQELLANKATRSPLMIMRVSLEDQETRCPFKETLESSVKDLSRRLRSEGRLSGTPRPRETWLKNLTPDRSALNLTRHHPPRAHLTPISQSTTTSEST